MGEKTQEEFEEEVHAIDDTIKILSKYHNPTSHIKCECMVCGNQWKPTASSLLRGNRCKNCHNTKGRRNEKMTTESFRNRLAESRQDVILLGEYHGAHTLTKFKCLVCGDAWDGEPTKILNWYTGCPTCGNRKRGQSNAINQDDFVRRVNEKTPNFVVLGEYENNRTPIKMKCLKHNEIFYGNPRCVLYKGGNACPKCNDSVGEKILCSILDEHNIHYNTQHTIDGCVYIEKLKFDAFDVDNNIAYEYQGEQHYKPVNFGGVDDDTAKENLRINQTRDRAKKEYCIEHNIPLIEIPYWERDNMRDFLIDKWKELNLKIA